MLHTPEGGPLQTKTSDVVLFSSKFHRHPVHTLTLELHLTRWKSTVYKCTHPNIGATRHQMEEGGFLDLNHSINYTTPQTTKLLVTLIKVFIVDKTEDLHDWTVLLFEVLLLKYLPVTHHYNHSSVPGSRGSHTSKVWHEVNQSLGILPHTQAHLLLPVHERKEPGNTGGFKLLTSGAWNQVPIRLQNRITWKKGVAKSNRITLVQLALHVGQDNRQALLREWQIGRPNAWLTVHCLLCF